MTGPEHYAEAERLLDGPAPVFDTAEEFDAARADNLAAAQVHATLALVAATIDAANSVEFHGAQDHVSHAVQNGEAWEGVLS